MSTKNEKIISWVVLVGLLGVLVYAIVNVNKPSGSFIKSLTEPQNQNNDKNPVSMEITPQPGDEKLIKKDLVVGAGAEVKAGDAVTVNYIGTFTDGKKFDSSYDRKTPFSFTIGKHKVIRGWEVGLLGMKVGGKRELTVPPELAYGPAGVPNAIPGNSTLKFTIELLDTKNIGQEKINLNP